jgi:hypothetical protein
LNSGKIDFKKGHQPGTDLLKNGESNLFADCNSNLVRWRKYFSQLLNVLGVNDVRHTEIHTEEPLVREPSVFEVELSIKKLKSHKSPGIGQIPGELIKAEGITIRSGIHKLSISICNKDELPEDIRSRPLHLSIRRVIKQIGCNYRGISPFPTTYKILSIILLSRLTLNAEEFIADPQCVL